MTIFGMMRIKNEVKWIQQVIRSILPICERVFILDDNSSDGTPDFCEAMGEKVTVIRKTVDKLDEAADKEMLLERVCGCVSDVHLRGNVMSPYWALTVDGDEVLHDRGRSAIVQKLENTTAHAFKLPIWYLWDSNLTQQHTPGWRRVRVDGVYRTFARPSIFRLFNRAFRYQSTPWGNGANFHCSSIPQELLHGAYETIDAPLWHLGYNDREDRLRKFEWYSKIDPNNEAEGKYLHCVQGDVPEVPADARLKWAGPMEFEMR